MNYYQGIFDIQNDNKTLYEASKILNEIRKLRTQFHHCYIYLSTCTKFNKDNFDKLMENFQAREHIYQSIHSYSIHDLLSLEKLFEMLNETLKKAKKHVRQCFLCTGKGFICEVCKNCRDVLFPFDDSKTIGRCEQCSNLYHRSCWMKIDQDCLRCYRIIERERQKFKQIK